MDDLGVAGVVRALRLRAGWRQRDLAARAGVSQQTVSRLERAQLEELTVRSVRAVGAALDVRLPFDPRWRRGDAARLLDAAHASLVDAVVGILRRLEWTAIVEYSFSHYGERGSVDILAWQATYRALLVIEVKSRVVDSQALFAGLDRKARLAPQLVTAERGWRPVMSGRAVVLPETTASRTAVRRLPNSFAAAFPDSSRRVRAWLRQPLGRLSGVWFLTRTRQASGSRVRGPLRRLSGSKPRSLAGRERAAERRTPVSHSPGE